MEVQKSISASLQEMGTRTKKRVLAHLLVENAYDSNLLPDISKCNYLGGNLGSCHLEPLSGLPAFVDDIFVYGYLRGKDLFSAGGKLLCSNAKDIVAKVSTAARETYSRFLPTSIVHTIRKGNTICGTISAIEQRAASASSSQRRGEDTKSTWEELYKENPTAVFVAKVDSSELSIEAVDAGIEQFARLLRAHGFGIYSVDYTQDFSGTLDREKLVQELLDANFELQHRGGEREGTILDNTSDVGEHVCTWVSNGTRTKVYNKIVSNFEAGEVQKPLGAKLAEYVDCPNEHLRKTFLHPEVQKRGCTRIEISVYGRDFSKKQTSALVETLEALGEIFEVQPAQNLWKNLSKHLDRCLLVSCKENREIFLAWYCHTRTNRIAGVRVQGNPDKWEGSILWTIAEFGFRRCPIFRIDVASLDPIEILPLRCYTKDSPTILAESTMPTKVHKNAPRIEFFLPSTEHIEWQWRTKKAQAIGVEKSPWEIFEVPSIEREISFLSKRKRQRRLEDIADAMEGDKWAEATKVYREELEKKRQIVEKQKQEDRKRIAEAMEKHQELATRICKREELVGRILDHGHPTKMETLASGKYRILAYMEPRDVHPTWKARGYRIFLGAIGETPLPAPWTTQEALGGKRIAFLWATEQLLRIVEHGKFHGRGRLHTAAPGEELVVETSGNWIQKVRMPKYSGAVQEYEELQQELFAIRKSELQRRNVLLCETEAPNSKERMQILHMQEGEYQCWYYAKSTYRGKPRTILFLEQKCDDCVSGTCSEMHARTAVWGHFLEEELQKIDLCTCSQPLYCKIGRERTTKAKKKDRIVHLA